MNMLRYAVSLWAASAALLMGCDSLRNTPAESGSPTISDAELTTVVKNHLIRSRWILNSQHSNDLSIFCRIPLLTHDPVNRKLSFPDLQAWGKDFGREFIPMTNLPVTVFSYGGRTAWIKSWRRDDAMCVWILRPTFKFIYGEMGYAQVRCGKVISTTVVAHYN